MKTWYVKCYSEKGNLTKDGYFDNPIEALNFSKKYIGIQPSRECLIYKSNSSYGVFISRFKDFKKPMAELIEALETINFRENP
jgi:hypothetical protein